MRTLSRDRLFSLAAAAIFPIAVVGWYVLNLPRKQTWPIDALFNGQLAILASWSALSRAPWFFRWPCAFAVFGAVAKPLHSGDLGIEPWQQILGLSILPHALLTFALLGLLRALGAEVSLAADGPAATLPKQKVLPRKLLGCAAGATAVGLAAWKLCNDLQAIVWPQGWGARQILIEQSTSLFFTAADLLALWAVLRARPLSWRLALLPVIILLMHATIWSLAARSAFGEWLRWSSALAEATRYDLFYLAPMSVVLLFVRDGGYRWRVSPSEKLDRAAPSV